MLSYKHKHTKMKALPSQTIRWRNPDSPQSHYQDTRFSLIRQEEKLQLQKNSSLSRSTDYVQEVLSHVNTSSNANVFSSHQQLQSNDARLMLKVLAFLWHIIIIKTVQQSSTRERRHLTESCICPRLWFTLTLWTMKCWFLSMALMDPSHMYWRNMPGKRERTQIFQTLTALLSY